MGLTRINRDKRGIFFTILAIAMLFLFLASYTIFALVQDRTSISKRIGTMNNFVFSLEQDLSRQLYIVGFRTILLFEDRIVKTGDYIDDFDSRFEEAFFDGTLDGETQELMQGATFSDMQAFMQQKGEKVNVGVSLLNPSVSVSQEDPWNVKVTLSVNMIVRDKGNLASWDKDLSVVSYIPIENFEDPIYVVSANSMFTNKINKTIYEPFVDGEDVSKLRYHAENSFYINSTSAPSFLNRLQGNLGASDQGIESLVSFHGLEDKTRVDYIYFSTSDPESWRIDGMPSWFRLDDPHLDVYGVRHLKIENP